MDEAEKERQRKIKEIYRYDGMSNQVLRVDRDLIENKTDIQHDAAISQPKSMAGKIDLREMGSAVRNTELDEEERSAAEKEFQKRLNSSSQDNSLRSRPVIQKKSLLDDISQLNYLPTDDYNSDIYDQIVLICSQLLGDDIPHSILADAADLIIVTLKTDENVELENKRSKIEDALGVKIDNSTFNPLLKLTGSISDYGTDINGSAVNGDDSDEEGEEEDEKEKNTLLEEVEEEDEEEVESGEHNDSNDIISGNLQNDIMNNTETIDLEVVQAGQEVVTINNVDEFFLQRKLRAHFKNLEETKVQEMTNSIYSVLSMQKDYSDLEQNLLDILGSKEKGFAHFIISNKDTLYWGHILNTSDGNGIKKALEDMENNNLSELVEAYNRVSKSKKRSLDEGEELSSKRTKTIMEDKKNFIDLENFELSQDIQNLIKIKIKLPENSFKRVKNGYEEIHVAPPEKVDDDFPLVKIESLPKWARTAFPSSETSSLNRIQSEVYPTAFQTDANILLCAPTGAGKTNVAMLTILRAMSHYYKEEKNTFDLKSFKVVYIAPLKALVQEQVREFQRRLHHFGINVAELTGDSNLSKQQIAETQVLVATPEKLDIITRKSTDTSFHKLVRLIIIDEVHLLHDERGPVIESIVARVLRDRSVDSPARLVALSATLPNYMDVAKFLKVPAEGMFYFDSSFRPCPLAQQFCGITEKSILKKKNAMNQACYDKVLEATKEGHQVIVFVHSRKDTARTARWLLQKLTEDDKLSEFCNQDKGSIEILKTESNNVSDTALAELLCSGLGIHHAGLSKDDRSLSEDLFADGLLKVLVSTATLAWGVNLPAHTVIIKGTEIYSPEKGDWTMLPPQDILQMLGRAGRPRYDVNGEGIIITNQSDVKYYLAVLNQQLPIESQMIKRVIDCLNAEVVLGNISTIEEATDWLKYSYLSTRMSQSPDVYNINGNSDSLKSDIVKFQHKIVYSALKLLQKHNLLRHNEINGNVEATELGKIASHFYISYSSIAMYNRELGKNSTLIDVLRIFAMSEEFKHMSVRSEEKPELEKLLDRCPIPIKEKATDPLAKSNILLQVYISKLKLEGFALNADMIYISQSAGRLFRALYEICLRKGWPRLTKMLLTICKCIENRMWPTNSPFRQFKKCPTDIIRRAEASGLPWIDILNIKTPQEAGEVLRAPQFGKVAFDLIQRFPKIEISCNMQPITNSLIQFELEIIPSWLWDFNVSGSLEPFLVLVEDTDGEEILYQDNIRVNKDNINSSIYLEFVIFLKKSMLPPNYFVSVISEKWLNCEYKIPIIFDTMKLPKQFPAPLLSNGTPLREVKDLQVDEFSNLYKFRFFNRIQSMVFDTLYHDTESTLICAPKDSGKITMIELALLNHWRKGRGRALYICPSKDKVEELTKNWKKRFSHIAGGKIINCLSENLQRNIKTLAQSHLVLATPEEFNYVSRRWPQRKNIKSIELAIFDDIHEIGDEIKGAIYEIIITRMVFISTQLEQQLRVVALGASLANAKDLGEWIGVKKENVFNFAARDRQIPLKVEIETSNSNENPSSNRKVLVDSIKTISSSPVSDITTTIFVADRNQCLSVSTELIKISTSAAIDLLRTDMDSISAYLNRLQGSHIGAFLQKGVGVLYEGMSSSDKRIIQKLHDYNVLSLLVCSRQCCAEAPLSNNIVIATTNYFEGKENRYIDYSINSILDMVGAVKKPSDGSPSHVKLVTTSQRKDFYKKFLLEGLPIESFVPFQVVELLSSEIANETLETKQDCIDLLTYTYLYRRIHANPSFYGVKEVNSEGISLYLTELVEEAVNLMSESDLLTINEVNEKADDVEEKIYPTNACIISGYHNVYYESMCQFSKSASGSLRLRDLLELLASSFEFQSLPIRANDISTLKKLYELTPLKLSSELDTRSTKTKVFILLQAYFSGLRLSPDLSYDTTNILKVAPALASAMVDVLSANGLLNATVAMDLSQMIVQGVWDTDSPLKQIPFFNEEILQKCKEFGVETVYDVMSLEDEERENILTLPEPELNKVAEFVNNYPNIEINCDFDNTNPLKPSESRILAVTVTRDEDPETLDVVSKSLPYKKPEGWWLFVGDKKTSHIYSIKKVTLGKISQKFELEIELDEVGSYELTLWCVCDSYLDVDKELSFNVTVST
ncbi:Pre-mRNA-splicing helicase BRR2 [Kluyveromyces marxianus]